MKISLEDWFETEEKLRAARKERYNYKTLEEWDAAQKRLEKAKEDISLEAIRKVRNRNGFRLYPLDWELINYEDKKGENPAVDFGFTSARDFEKKLKTLYDELYDWNLYETCPKCGKGIRIPILVIGSMYPFCGCSEYPKCDFSMTRGGTPLGYPTDEEVIEEWRRKYPHGTKTECRKFTHFSKKKIDKYWKLED